MPLLTDAAFLLGNRWHPLSYARTASDVALLPSMSQTGDGTGWTGSTAGSAIGGTGVNVTTQAARFTVASALAVAGVAVQNNDAVAAGGTLTVQIRTGAPSGGAVSSGVVVATGSVAFVNAGALQTINVTFDAPVTLSPGTTYTVTFALTNPTQSFGMNLSMSNIFNPAGSTLTVLSPRMYSNNGGVWTDQPDGWVTRFAFRVAGATDSASRTTTGVRTVTQAQASTDAALASRVYPRTATDLHLPSTQAATWAATFSLTSSDTRRVVSDYPVTNATRHITGTVRDGSGNPFLSGATVDLIRDRDGMQVASTTSSLVNGTYEFLRDTNDPFTYTVRAFFIDATSNQVEDITVTGLTPTSVPPADPTNIGYAQSGATAATHVFNANWQPNSPYPATIRVRLYRGTNANVGAATLVDTLDVTPGSTVNGASIGGDPLKYYSTIGPNNYQPNTSYFLTVVGLDGTGAEATTKSTSQDMSYS